MLFASYSPSSINGPVTRDSVLSESMRFECFRACSFVTDKRVEHVDATRQALVAGYLTFLNLGNERPLAIMYATEKVRILPPAEQQCDSLEDSFRGCPRRVCARFVRVDEIVLAYGRAISK